MIILGVILLLLGWLLGISLLTTLGIVLVVIGLLLLLVGYAGQPVAGRRWWF